MRPASAAKNVPSHDGAERAILVEHVPGRRAAAVDVARRRHAGIVLPPLRHRNRLAGPAIGLPGPLAVVRGEAEVRVLHHPAHAARRRIVVVVLEDVAERSDRLFVAVAVVVSDDLRIRAVRIHPRGESADVDMPVVARLAGVSAGSFGNLNGPDRVRTVRAEDAERLPRSIGEHRRPCCRS